MPVDTTPLNNMTDIDDRVKQMVLAMPDFSIGDQVHTIFVNKLTGSTPGVHSDLGGPGARFIDIFFPGWQPVSYEANVGGLTGLDDNWWANFAVAVLCQSMLVLTQDTLHDQLQWVQINSDITSFNATLNNQATPFYSFVFSQAFTDFSTPFAAMDHATALAQYKQALMDGVNIHALWYADGLWKNPDWEMYHHYIKLLALGMAAADIDQFIGQLQSAGLPIPDDMAPGTWRTYSGYLYNKPTIDHGDIDSMASDGIMRSEWVPGMEETPGTDMPEENSYEFTADGQPGSKYRSTGTGSCFTADTRVLMHDRSRRRIDEIRPGDWVLSPGGPRQVALVATPLRRGRTLYSLNGLRFRFTASHPFVNGGGTAQQPQLQSVEPHELKRWVPFLAKSGIGRLGPGAIVRRAHSVQAGQTTAVEVQSVSLHPPNGADELLYDVILQPDQSGTSEYFAGDEDNLFLVASEIPHMLKAPYATRAMIGMLAQALPALQEQFASLDRTPFTALLDQLKRRVSGELVYKSLLHLSPPTPEAAVESALALDEAIASMVGAFVTPELEYNWRAGQAYEALASRLAEEVEAAIELGWRTMPAVEGERLALSVSELHLDHEYGIPLDERLQLAIRLEIAGKNEEEKLILDSGARESTPFVRCFDRVLYFGTPLAKARTEKRLQFSFYSERSDAPVLTASAHLPHRLHPPYRRFSPWVYTASGQACGHLYFDVRLLSVAEIDQEEARRAHWQAAAREAFAHELGLQMGRELVQIIAAMAPAGKRLSASSPDETPSVKVAQILSDPEGDDLSGEYVVIENQNVSAVNLTNWTLSDEKGHTYTFPAFMLPAGATVKVWTKCGGNEPQNLFWCRKQAVWNNRGDTVLLKDSSGHLVDSRSYGASEV
ncbi:MAG: lamin tail domain-containing protein [Chloroflexi bacterium]|nr:lamin tail domain-containing protein [Chloroflexota bacterium]MCI0576890.1 lamin tail domain-containing protein [Chloroflexota bacterium]MCI0646456.1 lamin tail domain-containing protein [Chloroflexota bacterium]MCI0729923.1 lamin tail domain-containing protein [Chloroflexota bacterium]